jgi:membrane-bound lytic murein transglycosylase F
MRVDLQLKTWCCLIVTCGLLAMSGCEQPLTQNDLEALRSRGELVLITRNNSACYYEGPHGPAGFEYELAKAFADHLGVTLRVRIIENEADMIAALRPGKVISSPPGFPSAVSRATRLLALDPAIWRWSSWWWAAGVVRR